MRLALVGDVMLGRGVAAEIELRPPESFWGDMLPVLRRADLAIANLECAITTHPHPWTRYPKVFHFKAPPKATAVLRTANIRLVSLANNHILDFEEEGLLDTLRYLDEAGIAHAGAGRNLEEARRPAVVEAGGTRVGMVAFTDNEPPWAAGPNRPGTNFLAIAPDEETLSVVEESIHAARAAGAEIVILSLHWGPNMVERPPTPFREFARAAVERGADAIYGHSAHIFQGVEVYRHRPILYDTGDFLDDYAVDPILRNDRSVCFLLEGEGATLRELRMIPARLHYARVERAQGEDRAWIVERMQALSAEFGTRVELADGEMRVPLAP